MISQALGVPCYLFFNSYSVFLLYSICFFLCSSHGPSHAFLTPSLCSSSHGSSVLFYPSFHLFISSTYLPHLSLIHLPSIEFASKGKSASTHRGQSSFIKLVVFLFFVLLKTVSYYIPYKIQC